MENGSLQYENQILKSELEAEHFILTQMAELGKVRNVRECQVAINNLLEKIGRLLIVSANAPIIHPINMPPKIP